MFVYRVQAWCACSASSSSFFGWRTSTTYRQWVHHYGEIPETLPRKMGGKDCFCLCGQGLSLYHHMHRSNHLTWDGMQRTPDQSSRFKLHPLIVWLPPTCTDKSHRSILQASKLDTSFSHLRNMHLSSCPEFSVYYNVKTSTLQSKDNTSHTLQCKEVTS